MVIDVEVVVVFGGGIITWESGPGSLLAVVNVPYLHLDDGLIGVSLKNYQSVFLKCSHLGM